MKKKLLTLSLALLLLLTLTACGGGTPSGNDAAQSGENDAAVSDIDTQSDADESTDAASVTLNVACTAVPHAEILQQVVDALDTQGIELNIRVYGDYVVPNTAVEEGDMDVNFFQHKPYLDEFNETRGTHLVDVAGIHIEPIGIYGGRVSSLEELPDGGAVGVPNDSTNEGRALTLLAAQGLLTLRDGVDPLSATPNDIAENPKNLTFVELEAAMVPTVLSEVDIAVINSNYAMEAGLNPMTDSLAIEDSDSPYVNVLVVREGNENDPRVLALIDALRSDAVRDYIITTYGGAVVPAF